MRTGKILAEKRNTTLYNRLKQSKDKDFSVPIEFQDIIENNIIAADSFSMNEIAINLRSGYQLKLHCCICGERNTEDTPVVMHHIKHIRKGKVSGFAQVMKSLNRKTIPTCKPCHKKIHHSTYNRYKLKHLYDLEMILV